MIKSCTYQTTTLEQTFTFLAVVIFVSVNYYCSSQIRRCAVSIPSNIAEGAARSSKNEFNHFLSISLGSLVELETQLLVAKNLKYLDVDSMNDLTADLTAIRRMALGLKNTSQIKTRYKTHEPLITRHPSPITH